jgi:hypothetical protein
MCLQFSCSQNRFLPCCWQAFSHRDPQRPGVARRLVDHVRRFAAQCPRNRGRYGEPKPESRRGKLSRGPCAQLKPTIGTEPGIAAVRQTVGTVNGQAVQTGPGSITLPIDFGWELDLWGRLRRGVTSAREAQASAADLENARLSLHAELAIDYFELRSADAQTKLLEETIKAYTQALQLTQDRFDGGAAPQSDVTQARTQLDTARVQLTGRRGNARAVRTRRRDSDR